jgi:spore coat protein CotH
MMSRLFACAVSAAVAAAVVVSVDMQAQTAPAEPDAAAPLFDDSQLADLHLRINSRDWETLKSTFRSNAYYPADFVWQSSAVRNIGIRSRGNGSRNGTKPGLRVDFDRYSAKQKFLGLKSVVLRNNTQDPSDLRERLGMQFFARMGMPAPRELHVRLFVNNAYAGLYTLVEAVDRAFLARTLGTDDGFLYDYDYPPDAAPYYFEYRGEDPAAYVPLPFNPETNDSNPRPDVVERMIFTINSTSATEFRSAIEEFVDVRAFVRYVAIEAFLAEQDGFVGDWGMNNYYLYRPLGRNQFTIVPWDKSHAFVRGVTSSIWTGITGLPESGQNRLIARLLGYRDLFDLFLETLTAAAAAASEPIPDDSRGWLERELERELLQIRDASLADTLKPFTNEEFEAEVARLRVFAQQRASMVMAEVAQSRAAAAAQRLRR